MKGKNKKLFYVDLYAGDGICKCNRAPHPEWEPPYFSLIEHAKTDNLDLKCVFNDKDAIRINSLREKLKPYEEYVLRTFNKDGNSVYKEGLKLIPPNEWSIFFLDPSNHTQLNFLTVEEISRHSYSFGSYTRRPELIITLMTYTMQQYLKLSKRENLSLEKREKYLLTIDDAIGTNEWRRWLLNEEEKKKFHEIICDIFIFQLSKLGYDTVPFNITQTTKENVIYYLIFATSIPGAYKIISKNFETFIERTMKEKWVKENFNFYYRAIKKEEGIKLLDEFY